ncbi:hypothetical protein HYFRA_00005174 [Hymenoscyphus fraxineus]|uniref:ABM domain-containing protein n=1 Tax=Hymenoscyphus fraxineus TaxID=746836 RepID=A0A9N9LDE0_9HELO|nr:hypothetical protein HYFRA_00005174 [Hymenoscyphus fraxineus]
MSLYIIATFAVNEGKLARAIEIFKATADSVKKNEPDCLRFEVMSSTNAETKQDEIVVLETFANQAALELHQTSDFNVAFFKTIMDEELLAAPPVFKATKFHGGLLSRV